MKLRLYFTLLLSISLFGTGCDKHTDSPDLPIGLGKLSTQVHTGTDNAWRGRFDGTAYWLENEGNPQAVRYFYSAYDGAVRGTRTVEAVVDLSKAASSARAGILYGLRTTQSGTSYYAIVAGPDHQLDIYYRDQTGFNLTLSNSFSPSPSGAEHISVVEAGEKITIHVNGQQVSALQSAGTGEGAVGIIALGSGHFGFLGYRERAAGVTAPSAATTPTTAQTTEPALRMREHSILDKSRGRVPAFHVLVPEGWHQEGHFEFVPAYSNVPYLGSFTVSADDGRHVSYVPFLEFTYTDFAQLPFMQPYEGRPAFRQPPTLGDVLTTIAKADPNKTITELEVVSESVLPEATQVARQQSAAIFNAVEANNRRMAGTGEQQRYAVEAREVVTRFRKDGKQLEAVTFAVVVSNVFVQNNGAVSIAKWNIRDSYSVGGPVGSDYLQDPALAAIARSIRANNDWSYAIDQWYQTRRVEAVREGIARAQIANNAWQNTRAQDSEDILDIGFNGWKQRNAISDRGQSNLVNAIHERTTYATPNGSTVQLPSYYQNVYTDNSGNYVLHNDAFYNVNNDPSLNNVEWTQMQAVQ